MTIRTLLCRPNLTTVSSTSTSQTYLAVINASGYPPERVLDKINDIELKGWKCVGNLYDNSKTIVFQSSDPSFKEEGGASKSVSTGHKTLFVSITTIIVSFYAYYKYRLSQHKEAEVNSS